MEPKSTLRREIRSLLDNIHPAQVAAASGRICDALCDHAALWQGIGTVTTFSARADEIDLSALHRRLPETKMLYPLCHRGGILTFHHVPHPSGLAPGRLGILEPHPELHPEVPVEHIDLFLCPGLAFGKDGSRLGHGGGFYDRALARKKASASAIGIGMEMQVRQTVPHTGHDMLMDSLVTERGLRSTR